MTIILRENPDHTDVLACDQVDTALRAGMRIGHAEVPRSLGDDRALVDQMSDEAWYALRLSNVESPADIEKVSTLLRVAEANRNLLPGALSIIAALDTARAALGLTAFNQPIPRLAGFIFDGAALALAAGAAPESDLINDLRLRMPLAAKASGAIAFLKRPGICDPETAAAAARRDGYQGLVIGPI